MVSLISRKPAEHSLACEGWLERTFHPFGLEDGKVASPCLHFVALAMTSNANTAFLSYPSLETSWYGGETKGFLSAILDYGDCVT